MRTLDKKPQKGVRRLAVNGQVWWWCYGGGNAALWPPGGARKAIVSAMALTGRWPDTFERGQWKRTTDGMITPGMVRAYVDRILAGTLSLCYTSGEAREQGVRYMEDLYPRTA